MDINDFSVKSLESAIEGLKVSLLNRELENMGTLVVYMVNYNHGNVVFYNRYMSSIEYDLSVSDIQEAIKHDLMVFNQLKERQISKDHLGFIYSALKEKYVKEYHLLFSGWCSVVFQDFLLKNVDILKNGCEENEVFCYVYSNCLEKFVNPGLLNKVMYEATSRIRNYEKRKMNNE